MWTGAFCVHGGDAERGVDLLLCRHLGVFVWHSRSLFAVVGWGVAQVAVDGLELVDDVADLTLESVKVSL